MIRLNIPGALILAQPQFRPDAHFVVLRWPPFTGTNLETMVRLASQSGLPYFNMTAVLEAEKESGRPNGDLLKLLRGKNPSPALVTEVAATWLRDPTFAGGAILDALPNNRHEAVALAKILKVTALIDLNAPNDDLVFRATEDRQCPVCQAVYQWRRPPATRALMCTTPACLCILGLADPITPPATRVAKFRERAAELAAYYAGTGVPHITLPAGNLVDEEAMLELLVAAVKARPVKPAVPDDGGNT